MDTLQAVSLPNFSNHTWKIICDFDGTITPFDITDALLARFAHASWEAVELEWVAGKITARECMERQVALLHVSLTELDAYLATVPLTKGFKEFVQFCTMHNLNLLVVSDGLNYAIKHILASHGITTVPVIANKLLPMHGNRYKLAFPYSVPGCWSGVCKCSVARADECKTLLIGDGRSDCCLSGVVAFTLAKEGKKLQAHCQAHDYPHTSYENFVDIRTALETVLQSLPTAADPASFRRTA